MKRWTRTASIISDFTVPPVWAVPFYTLLSLYDQARSGGDSLDLLARLFFSITFDVTIPTCFILFLFARKKVSDLHISVRQQRTLPYLVILATNLVGFGFIYWLFGAGPLAAVMLSNVVNRGLMMLINLYWKISGHAIGITTPLAVIIFLFGWVGLPFVLFVPLIGWARVYLHAHTLGQVIAGSLFGFGLTILELAFIFQPLGWV